MIVCYCSHMARSKSYKPETLTNRALSAFWEHGFHATSMDDLVRVTKVGRHGIYNEFGGKKGLFLACIERYQFSIVSPAFNAWSKQRRIWATSPNISSTKSRWATALDCLAWAASSQTRRQRSHHKTLMSQQKFHSTMHGWKTDLR